MQDVVNPNTSPTEMWDTNVLQNHAPFVTSTALSINITIHISLALDT